MLREAVFHVAHGSYAYPAAPDTLRLTLRAAKGICSELQCCIGIVTGVRLQQLPS